jgi:hypothetical protein
MADQQILVAGTSAVPVTYTGPNSMEAALLCVNATIDGAAASAQYLATVEIISDGGVVVARCPCFTTLPVGGTAEISWFRLRNQTSTVVPFTTPYEELIQSLGGLVLYWKLDDSVGSPTAHDSAGTNDGTVYGAITFGEPKVADLTSAAFPVGTAMVAIKSRVPGINANNLMSAVCWVETVAVVAQNTVAWADALGADGRWFQWYTLASGVQRVVVFGTDATPHTVTGAVAVNDGAKHMIGFTYAATTPSTGAGAVVSIYVDGVLDTATPVAMGGFGLAQNNNALAFGAEWRNVFDDPNGIGGMVGTMDEFALFTSTLSAADMASINTAGRV